MPWGWAGSPRSPRRLRATTRSGRTRPPRWPRCSSSTGTRRRSSASATRCRCGRRARWARSRSGRPARASSTSTGSSAGRPTSGRRRSTRTRCRSSPTAPPEEGYHFTEDMTDRAIDWIRQQKALMPDKPFFAYFAPGATHAPHHVPKEWADKYKGRFDQGWDRLREETLARQKELGVIPADAELTARPAEIPGLGRHARRPQAGAGAADGGVRRVLGAHRPPRRPADRRPRRSRDPRRHTRLLHHRGQRCLAPRAPPTAASTSSSY